MIARRLWPFLALVATAPLAAQEPPAHLTICETDSAARHFESQMRYLLSASDTSGRSRLADQGLSPAPVDSVTLVSEERLCVLASTGYAAVAAPGMDPPFPVAVVHAPGRLLVQLGGRPAVVILDEAFRPVGKLSLAAGRS